MTNYSIDNVLAALQVYWLKIAVAKFSYFVAKI